MFCFPTWEKNKRGVGRYSVGCNLQLNHKMSLICHSAICCSWLKCHFNCLSGSMYSDYMSEPALTDMRPPHGHHLSLLVLDCFIWLWQWSDKDVTIKHAHSSYDYYHYHQSYLWECVWWWLNVSVAPRAHRGYLLYTLDNLCHVMFHWLGLQFDPFAVFLELDVGNPK